MILFFLHQVNSGNLLYLLDFQLEKLKVEDEGEHREKSRLLLQQVFMHPGKVRIQ